MNMDNEAIIASIYEKVEKMGSHYHEDKFYLSATEEATEDEAIPKDTKISELPSAVYVIPLHNLD